MKVLRELAQIACSVDIAIIALEFWANDYKMHINRWHLLVLLTTGIFLILH